MWSRSTFIFFFSVLFSSVLRNNLRFSYSPCSFLLALEYSDWSTPGHSFSVKLHHFNSTLMVPWHLGMEVCFHPRHRLALVCVSVTPGRALLAQSSPHPPAMLPLPVRWLLGTLCFPQPPQTLWTKEHRYPHLHMWQCLALLVSTSLLPTPQHHFHLLAYSPNYHLPHT